MMLNVFKKHNNEAKNIYYLLVLYFLIVLEITYSIVLYFFFI